VREVVTLDGEAWATADGFAAGGVAAAKDRQNDNSQSPSRA
jgi:hypothetical protein